MDIGKIGLGGVDPAQQFQAQAVEVKFLPPQLPVTGGGEVNRAVLSQNAVFQARIGHGWENVLPHILSDLEGRLS